MTKLIYDTETTSLPQDRLPLNHPEQPHLVELGMKMTDDDGNLIQCASFIVKPEGWVIPPSATAIHGISHELAARVGLPLKVVMAVFCEWYNLADEVIAHNEAFDDKIVRIAIHRLGRNPSEKLLNVKRTCTVVLASPIVGLPPTAKMVAKGFTKNKPANLTECVKYFFGEDFAGAHRALNDVEQCARVYFEIIRRGREKELSAASAIVTGETAA